MIIIFITNITTIIRTYCIIVPTIENSTVETYLISRHEFRGVNLTAAIVK